MRRDWQAVLTEAAERGLGGRECAKEQGVSPARVTQAQNETGIRLADKSVKRADATRGAFEVSPPPADGNEEWRPVAGWEDQFEVSNRGGLRRADTHAPKSTHPMDGYRVMREATEKGE